MNASIPAVLLMIVLSSAWLLGRRRTRPFLRSTDTSAVVALNRGQIERVQPPAPSPQAGELPRAALPATGSVAPAMTLASAPGGSAAGARVAGPRRQRLSQLRAVMAAGSREQRLQALDAAAQWPRREGLPLLRLGLRDPDPAVMAAAAAAIERFRGRSAAAQDTAGEPRPWRGRPQPASAATSPPRSVLRTR